MDRPWEEENTIDLIVGFVVVAFIVVAIVWVTAAAVHERDGASVRTATATTTR